MTALVVVPGRQHVERDVVVRLRRQFNEINRRLPALLRRGDLRPIGADRPVQAEPLPQHGVVQLGARRAPAGHYERQQNNERDPEHAPIELKKKKKNNIKHTEKRNETRARKCDCSRLRARESVKSTVIRVLAFHFRVERRCGRTRRAHVKRNRRGNRKLDGNHAVELAPIGPATLPRVEDASNSRDHNKADVLIGRSPVAPLSIDCRHRNRHAPSIFKKKGFQCAVIQPRFQTNIS